MAKVAYGAEARINSLLDYLISEWESLPALFAEWSDWDTQDRLDFVLDWPIRDDRLRELLVYAKCNCLNPLQ